MRHNWHLNEYLNDKEKYRILSLAKGIQKNNRKDELSQTFLYRYARPPTQPSTESGKAEMKTEVLAQSIFHYESVKLCVKGKEAKKQWETDSVDLCARLIWSSWNNKGMFSSASELWVRTYIWKKIKTDNSNPHISCTNYKHVIVRNCHFEGPS